MKYSLWKMPLGSAWVGLIFALSFLAWAFEATTQVERPGTPVSIRGKVLSLKDSELMVAGPSGATMTNANVERVEDVVVRDVKGRVMNLKYRGGEINVLVPPDIPLVKRML